MQASFDVYETNLTVSQQVAIVVALKFALKEYEKLAQSTNSEFWIDEADSLRTALANFSLANSYVELKEAK